MSDYHNKTDQGYSAVKCGYSSVIFFFFILSAYMLSILSFPKLLYSLDLKYYSILLNIWGSVVRKVLPINKNVAGSNLCNRN